MTVTEKAAYLRGLAAGLNLSEDKDETKLFNAILDIIDDLALTASDLEDELALVSEQVDAIDEDLDALESIVYDDEYDDDCDCCCDDDEMYEVECPACGETVYFDESALEDGAAECPACGEKLEFDFECDCEDCDCDE